MAVTESSVPPWRIKIIVSELFYKSYYVGVIVIVILHSWTLSFDIGYVGMLYIILMHICCFIFFFTNDLLLAMYFIFLLDYGKDVRQKTNSNDF